MTLADEVAHGILRRRPSPARLRPRRWSPRRPRRPPSSPARRGGGSGWWTRSTAPRSSSSAGRSSPSTWRSSRTASRCSASCCAPALDLLYWAVKGGGAWREAKGARRRADLLRRAAAGHAAHGGGEPLAPVGRAGGVPARRFRWPAASRPAARSSSAGWPRAARTSIPRLGPTMEWDVAAGDCIYRQSGRDGERPSPLTYNKPDLRNPSFVIGL